MHVFLAEPVRCPSEDPTGALIEKYSHALGVKEANTTTMVKEVSKIGLETGHGTQLPFDESNPLTGRQ